MTALALLLGIAAVGFGVSLWLRIPVIPPLLLLGFGLSFLPFAPSEELTLRLVEIGLALLVFAAGIELSPSRFRHQTQAVLWVAALQFLLMGLLGFGIGLLLGLGPMASAYVGFAISASSTLVAVRQLRQMRQMFQPFGRLVTGVLLIQDAALVVFLVIFAAAPESFLAFGMSLGSLLLLFIFALAAHIWLVPWLTSKYRADEESLLLFGLAILFAFGALSRALDLPLVAGAFLAGFTLAAFPVNGLLRGLVTSITDFFQALFFAALGSLLVLPTLHTLFQVVVFVALVVVITPPLVCGIAEWRGQSARSGLEAGLLLSQTSELGIVLGMVGMVSGHLDVQQFVLISLVAVITMTLTPLLGTDTVTWKLLHWHPSRRRKTGRAKLEGHTLVCGFGSAGMWVVKPLKEAGHRLLVVDDDPKVIEQLLRAGIPCLRGDASDEQVLEMAQAKKAKLVIASIPKIGDLLKVIHHVSGVKVIARVMEQTEADAVRRLGGVPILNAEEATEQFMKWFERSHQKDKETA
ncbi:MAG: cation:proton antiporter [Verrucomicrobiales bacterium]